MRLIRMKEITQNFYDVNWCHTVRLSHAHAEYRLETVRLDAAFLAVGRCSTKWNLVTYRAVVIWLHGACFSVRLLDFVNMDMNLRFLKESAIGEISGFPWMSSIVWVLLSVGC